VPREKLTAEQQVVADEYNRLRGRLCGLVESWDVGDKRERAMISTLKSLTYDSEAVVQDLVKMLEPLS
jgi:hypothetical protein